MNDLQANGQTSSSHDLYDDDLSEGIQTPLDIVCHDPQDRDQPCPICGGKGVILYDVPVDDRRYGKLHRCPNYPVSIDTSHQERLRRVGNLESFRNKTFENFLTDPSNGTYPTKAVVSLQKALQTAEDFARQPHGWVVFEGTYGCGKTHLAVAIANIRLEQHGEQVLFITAPDLLDYLRTTFSNTAEISYDETFDRIRNIQLLILDDLGVENPSGWAKEKLFQLLNYRYAKNLPTVITTNTPLEDLDPRISSRMLEADIVKHLKITAPDYRALSSPDNDDKGFSKLHLYKNMQFHTFLTHSPIPDEAKALEKALQVAMRYAAKPDRWLYLMGEYGVGKTHLAAAIANELQSQGKQVLFTTVPDLMDYLRTTFDPKTNARFDTRFQEIVNVPVLILDDLRLASATAWAQEKLFQIIDHRYITRMPTVITSSETMNDVAPRLSTRLMDKRVCFPFLINARNFVTREGKNYR